MLDEPKEIERAAFCGCHYEALASTTMSRFASNPVPLTTKDLLAAAKSIKPSTSDWFATARNYALYANEGGLYDDILEYLDGAK